MNSMSFTKFITGFFITAMGILFAVFAVMLILGQMQHNAMMEELMERKIAGRIVRIERGTRGGAYLDVNDNLSATKLSYYLTIVYFLDKHYITIGDSVSKEAGCDTLIFYKVISGDTVANKYPL